jgi:peptidyl-prolyl cis-trans isomerase B (cyclophilin B)
VLVVSGVAWLATRGGPAPVAAAAKASPSATAGATASATGDNPCPAPTVKPASPPKSWPKPPAAELAKGKPWKLVLQTTCGDVLISLDGAKAPQAVA